MLAFQLAEHKYVSNGKILSHQHRQMLLLNTLPYKLTIMLPEIKELTPYSR
jgi:hypothetical protein